MLLHFFFLLAMKAKVVLQFLIVTICCIVLFYGLFMKSGGNDIEPRQIPTLSNTAMKDHMSGSMLHLPYNVTAVSSQVVSASRAATLQTMTSKENATYSLKTHNYFTPSTPQLSTVSQSTRYVVHHLSNVVIDRGTGRGVYHIYSAYYDARSLPNRPAVIMFGYVHRRAQYSIYCKFMYDDNSTKCIGNVVHRPLIAANVWPEEYFCKMNSHDRVPTHVMLSEHESCKSGKWSNPIPVWNRESTVPDGIGVCLMSCMYSETKRLTQQKAFDKAVEYVAMAQILGAKIVTIYNKNISQDLVQKLLQLYPGLVDMVQWYDLTGILHSRGQRVLVNDCLYKNMKKVRYLVFIDLDEMIFPVSTNTWADMLRNLEKKGKYASFTFSNNFFAELPPNATSGLSCPYMKPKYFTRLKRLPWPNFKQHTKMKMIVKPLLLTAICIHDVCKPTLPGYVKTYRVPASVGLMAHYREPVPRWYIYGKGVEDRTALKYQDEMMEEMTRVCSIHNNWVGGAI